MGNGVLTRYRPSGVASITRADRPGHRFPPRRQAPTQQRRRGRRRTRVRWRLCRSWGAPAGAILFEVNPDRVPGESTVSVSERMSGAEYVRRVKEQIDEVDPSDVRELAAEGVALVDVRETEEWDTGHLPGAKHVPRGYLESRIDAAVPDRSQRVILYCASGSRSALAANTL